MLKIIYLLILLKSYRNIDSFWILIIDFNRKTVKQWIWLCHFFIFFVSPLGCSVMSFIANFYLLVTVKYHCNGVRLKIYLNNKLLWVQEGLNYKSLVYEVVQEIHSPNPPLIFGICNLNKSWAQHHHSLTLGLRLKYLKISLNLHPL